MRAGTGRPRIWAGLPALVGAAVIVCACSSWGSGASSGSEGSADGLTVSVLSATTDAAGTTLVVEFSGREDDGELIESTDRPVLRPADGNAVFALRRTEDATNPRRYTFVFPSVSPGSGFELEVGNVRLWDEEARQQHIAAAARGNAGEPVTTTVRGPWRVPLTVQDASSAAREVPLAATSAFGPGRITVERAVIGRGTVSFFGRIDGLEPGEFAVLEIAPAELSSLEGSFQFAGGRSGYGEGNREFELRFAGEAKRNVTLRVPFRLGRGDGAGRLAAYDGTSAVLELRLD